MAKKYRLQEIADFVNGEIIGNPDVEITALNGIESAIANEISFLIDKKHLELLESCEAGACIVPKNTGDCAVPTIEVERPDIAAARIHNMFLQKEYVSSGLHPAAVIGNDCQIPDDVSVGANVTIGNKVTLGNRVTLHAGVVIEDDVNIGDDTILFANVVIAKECIIGKRVILHHGAVVGSDGFGFATDERGNHITKPQVGNVQIDDDVQIGACSCVDRAAFGTTWIKSGARIDNLVQIAHNVVIGENSVIVAQVGIAGSASLGRSVVVGAKTGIKDHVDIGDFVMVAAMSGVHNNQPTGAVIGGAPAFDVKKWGRATAAYSRLPDMVKELRKLRKEVDRLSSIVQVKDETKRDEQ